MKNIDPIDFLKKVFETDEEPFLENQVLENKEEA